MFWLFFFYKSILELRSLFKKYMPSVCAMVKEYRIVLILFCLNWIHKFFNVSQLLRLIHTKVQSLNIHTLLVITILESRLWTRYLIPLMLCVLILYISGRTNSLKLAPNDRFLKKLFFLILIFSQSFCQKSAERKSPKKYFLYFVLISGLGFEPLAFRLISQYTEY